MRFSALKLPIELCTCRCMRPLHSRLLAEDLAASFGARTCYFRRLDAFLARGIAQTLRLDWKFNHGYPLKYLPDRPHFRTMIGAGSGGHLSSRICLRQEYHCVELRENMSAEIKRRFPAVMSL